MANTIASTVENRRIAGEHYINSPGVDVSPLLTKMWCNWIDTQFEEAQRFGYRYCVGGEQTSLEEMAETKIIPVSTANSGSLFIPWWMNLRFRYVHDYHHIQFGMGFSPEEEVRLFNCLVVTDWIVPQSLVPILRSEQVYQACAYELTGEFQPQKIVLTSPF